MACKISALGWVGGCLLALGSIAAASGDSRLATAVKERNQEAVRSLLNQHADVNATLADGATALHWAVHWDDLGTAELLIRAGAKVSAVNDYGVSPLSLACTNGNAAMVEKLLRAGADANAALPTGETALMTCARTGNADAVKALLARRVQVDASQPEGGQTALMWAAAQRHPEVVQALIAEGADVHARSKGGFTPLLFAARAGDVDTARALLAGGADVNETMPVRPNPMRREPSEEETPSTATDETVGTSPKAAPGGPGNGKTGSSAANSSQEKAPMGTITPLLIASASGHEALSIFLLERGANPNAVDGRNGATALHYCVPRGVSLVNSVEYFKDRYHMFPPNMPELVKALLAHGANPNVRHGKNPAITAGSGADTIGATPFLLAAATGDAEIMRLLVASGADPRLEARGGLTPLMAAAGLKPRRRDAPWTEAEPGALAAVKLLLELGADVNATNEGGLTALHAAATLGWNSVVQALVEHGANINAKDKHQQTPLTIALGMRMAWIPKEALRGEVKHLNTAELLLKLGATPVTAPGYFTEVEDSDVLRLTPKYVR